MNYIEFRRQMAPFKVFSVDDIRKKELHFDSRRLVEWQQKKYIEKIINRWYLLSETEITEEFLFMIANRIYNPSYVSFETALSYHGLIPEAVFSIISATSNKTKQFRTAQGNFFYHSLKPSLLFGYSIEKLSGVSFKIAEPEKAILDYLYLRPKIKDDDDFEAWRINTDLINNQIDQEKLKKYLTLFYNQALNERVFSLLKFSENG